MILALGMFLFSLPTLLPDEMQRRGEWRFPGNPRVGARDAYQFTGPGEERISLNGAAIAQLQDGRASLDDLWDMADTGLAWALIDGSGRVHGNFVITGIEEGTRDLDANGVARRIDFRIDLLMVDDDGGA